MPQGYEIEDTSQRVVNFMMSTYRSHQWSGLRRH